MPRHKTRRQNWWDYEVFSTVGVYWRALTVQEHGRPTHRQCRSVFLHKFGRHRLTNMPKVQGSYLAIEKAINSSVPRGTMEEFFRSSIAFRLRVRGFGLAYPKESPVHQ